MIDVWGMVCACNCPEKCFFRRWSQTCVDEQGKVPDREKRGTSRDDTRSCVRKGIDVVDERKNWTILFSFLIQVSSSLVHRKIGRKISIYRIICVLRIQRERRSLRSTLSDNSFTAARLNEWRIIRFVRKRNSFVVGQYIVIECYLWFIVRLTERPILSQTLSKVESKHNGSR